VRGVGWHPYCGAEYHGQVAGDPVVCDSETHPPNVMHRHSGTGFRWWGFMSYPRSGGT
jgi:hypothetical protein